MKINLKTFAILFAVGFAAGSARSGDIYNNLTTQDPGFGVLQLQNDQPVGQQIYLDSAQYASFPHLTNFTFEYFSTNASFSGTVQADVKFYQNNGTLTNGFATPSTVFYDSGLFNLYTPASLFGAATNVALLSFGTSELYGVGGPLMALSIALPSSFTIVYTISGLTGSDMVGLPIFNPSSTGTNYGSYWLNVANNWSLVTNNVTQVGIGMQLQATPEPSVIALGALGAVLLARFAKRRQ